MGNGHGAWSMLQRTSLTAASLIPIAQCPMPNLKSKIQNS